MSKLHTSSKLPVPILTDVVQVNGSLRPVALPWKAQVQTKPSEAASALAAAQDMLADQVIERVQSKLAQVLPEMMRAAVDEVLNEQFADISKIDEHHRPL